MVEYKLPSLFSISGAGNKQGQGYYIHVLLEGFPEASGWLELEAG